MSTGCWTSSEPRADHLSRLRNEGAEADIFCFWASRSGHGGPNLGTRQMKRLVALDLPIGFDVYFEQGEVPGPGMSGRCLCVSLEPGEEVEKSDIQDLGLLA